jgi:hypothetical protein
MSTTGKTGNKPTSELAPDSISGADEIAQFVFGTQKRASASAAPSCTRTVPWRARREQQI